MSERPSIRYRLRTHSGQAELLPPQEAMAGPEAANQATESHPEHHRRAYPYKQFSLSLMRCLGYVVDDAERKVALYGAKGNDGQPLKTRFGGPMMVSKDLFGVLDALCFNGRQIIGVQATSKAQMAAHRAKIEGWQPLRAWLDSGGLLELHGWSKRGRIWGCRIIRWRTSADVGNPAVVGWFDKSGTPIVADEE